MTRRKKLGWLVVIVLVAGAIGAWSSERVSTHGVAAHPPGDVGAPMPLAIGTRVRGELAVADPKGDLRVEGQVIDANEQPVGGARVTIDAYPPRATTTEADGTFVFDALLSRRYTLTATASDGVAGPVTTWIDATTPALIMRLRTAAGVDVTVIDANSGAPIEGATVEVRAPAVSSGKTSARGTAAIAPVVPGHWPLVVSAPHYANAFDSVSASPTARYKIAIALKHAVHVRGRVVDETGKAVTDALIWPESVGDWMATEADPMRDGVRSDGDGRFDIANAARAAYVLHAIAPDHRFGATGMVHIDDDTDGITIRVGAGARLAGRVSHKDGAAASGAVVRAVWTHGSRIAHVGRDGTFALDELPRTTLWLSANDGSASSQPRRIDLTDATSRADQNIVLDHDVTISGTVVDHTGTPVEGAQVTGVRADALDATANAASRVQELSDSSGRFTLTGLAEGQYTLMAARDSRQTRSGRTTVVAAGSTNVTLTVASTGKITGHVSFRDNSSPAAYTVRVGRGGLATQFTASDFTIDSPPGAQALWIAGPGFTATSVDGITVSEDAVADAGTIVLDRGRTVRGRVTNADGTSPVGGQVVAGALLSGTGQRVDTGESGPEFRSDVKQADVAADGSFELAGVATTTVSVVASVASGARSSPVAVPAGTDDVDGLVLTITRDARLSGSVIRDGAPAGALVNAQSQASPLTMFTVEAPEGKYQFDQLAPGRYTVAAITGSPLTGSPFYPRVVELSPGVPAILDLPVTPGAATLKVQAPGAGTGLVFVSTRPGSATSALALLVELGRQDGGQWALAPISGDSVEFHELTAGPARVCLVRIPMKSQMTPSALIEQIARAGASLAATCVTTQLGATSTVTLGGPQPGGQ